MPLLDKCVPAQGPFHPQTRDSVLLLTFSFDSRKRLPEVERVALLALPEMPEGLYDAARPKVDEARAAHHEKAKELVDHAGHLQASLQKAMRGFRDRYKSPPSRQG